MGLGTLCDMKLEFIAMDKNWLEKEQFKVINIISSKARLSQGLPSDKLEDFVNPLYEGSAPLGSGWERIRKVLGKSLRLSSYCYCFLSLIKISGGEKFYKHIEWVAKLRLLKLLQILSSNLKDFKSLQGKT